MQQYVETPGMLATWAVDSPKPKRGIRKKNE